MYEHYHPLDGKDGRKRKGPASDEEFEERVRILDDLNSRPTEIRDNLNMLREVVKSVADDRASKRAKLHQPSSAATGSHEVHAKPRQWCDPPLLNYDKYEIYEEIQMKMKDVGGKHLSWATAFIDLDIEVHLLGDYECWVRAQREQAYATEQLLNSGDPKDVKFYENLAMDIESDKKVLERERKDIVVGPAFYLDTFYSDGIRNGWHDDLKEAENLLKLLDTEVEKS